jgi:hypothetical protein
MTASRYQGSLLTDIQPSDRIIMKPFIDILKDYFLVSNIVDQIRNLRNQLAYVERSNIVVSQRYYYYVLL